MPLVRGGYPVNHAIRKYTGGAANVAQANIPPRSNQEWLGVAQADTAAALASGVATAVAVPVEVGDVIQKVSVLVGAAGAGTPTNSFAAVYSGVAVPALLAQSVSGGAAAVPAGAVFTFTLASPVTVTSVNAPNGYLYVSVAVAATVVPSLGTVPVAAVVGYKAFANSPLFLAASHGSALSTAAPATITGQTTVGAVPVVYLT